LQYSSGAWRRDNSPENRGLPYDQGDHGRKGGESMEKGRGLKQVKFLEDQKGQNPTCKKARVEPIFQSVSRATVDPVCGRTEKKGKVC